MNEFWMGILVTLAAEAVIGVFWYFVKSAGYRRDFDKIAAFIRTDDPIQKFRSTSVIASRTKLSKTRVREVCEKFPNKVRQDELGEDTWTPIG